MSRRRRASLLLVTICVASAGAVPLPAQQADPPIAEPAAGPRPPVDFDPVRHRPGRLRVKFLEGLTVRLRDGVPTDVAAGRPALAPALVALGSWSRAYRLSDAELGRLADTAREALARPVADPRLCFVLEHGDDVPPDDAIAALHASGVVEYALPSPRAVPPPVPGDFEPMQGYLDLATDGIGALCLHQVPGGRGDRVAVADIEYSWNTSHLDLPAITHIGPSGSDPFNDDNHGTAVLGAIGSLDNGWGTTGIVPDAELYTVAAWDGDSRVDAAIYDSLEVLGPGDVLLIEQQAAGPNWPGGSTQFGLVPVEWEKPVYDAIVVAVGNGVVVVEAAGNGSQDLDDDIYSTGNGDHWPFLPDNDSGAIMVGAGGSPTSFFGDLARLDFSNWGSTVDMQGYGDNVTTTGYGSLYDEEGKDLLYTAGFGGTSSASPIVAGAAAALQSVMIETTGGPLTPVQVSFTLATTGTPQMPGVFPATQNIGPRPDAAAAVVLALPELDADLDGLPDKVIWVDFEVTGPGVGTFDDPFVDFDDALDALLEVPTTITFKPGDDGWTGTVTEEVTLRASGGSAVLGS